MPAEYATRCHPNMSLHQSKIFQNAHYSVSPSSLSQPVQSKATAVLHTPGHPPDAHAKMQSKAHAVILTPIVPLAQSLSALTKYTLPDITAAGCSNPDAFLSRRETACVTILCSHDHAPVSPLPSILAVHIYRSNLLNME